MESTVLSYLLIALAGLGIVAVFVLIRTLGKLGDTAEALTGVAGALGETAKSATATSDEARAAVAQIRQQVGPTMLKVDVAVDAVNANLLRLDSIMGDIEATTGQVASASHAVSNLANAPVDVMSNLADRFRKAWRVRRAEVSEDVARYSDTISHAAQQVGHVEYAPSGGSAPAPSVAPAGPTAQPESEVVALIEPIVVVEAVGVEPVLAVETHFIEPVEPDVDDSDADFSSEEISHFSAAAVLRGDSVVDAGDEAVEP